MKRLICVGLSFILTLVLGSCDKSPDLPDEVFKLGDTKEYTVSEEENLTIADEVSKCVFSFPDGGSGDLKVSSIIEGPKLSELDADRFKVVYDGTGSMELLIPLTNDHIQAFVYGKIEGASVKPNIGENSWGVMIPQDTVEGHLRYEIQIKDSEPLKSSSTRYKAPASNYFAISRVSEDSDEWGKMVAFYHSIKQVADIWLNSLSASDQEQYRKLMNGNMKYDVMASSSNYYQHFNNWVVGKNAVFCLKPSTTLEGIAHETGHYMTHLLCGYTTYDAIYDAMPKTYWGLGGSIDHLFGMYYEGRVYLLEEYAHFSEFLATGSVENYDLYNIKDVNYFSQAVSANPSSKDYPSHEGFGTAILAALMRSEGMIHTYDITKKAKVPVPVVGAPLREIIKGVIMKGPKNINELYDAVAAYLSGKGESELKKLPAILEPLGWSYMAKGKLIDSDSLPMKDARVQPVVVADKEYYGASSTTTNEKGEFWIDKLPPGTSILRVCYNFVDNSPKDSTDIDITIDPRLVTNKQVDLETLKVEFKDRFEVKTLSNVYDTRRYGPGSSLTGATINSTCDVSFQGTLSIKNKATMSASFLNSADVSALITLNIDCYSDSPLTGTVNVRWSMADYKWTWGYVNSDMLKSERYDLSSIPDIETTDFGEGSYAPQIGTSAGEVTTISIQIDPKVLFANTRYRRYRWDPEFNGTKIITKANDSQITYSSSFTPSSFLINVSKKY